jgi:hypothetical protein
MRLRGRDDEFLDCLAAAAIRGFGFKTRRIFLCQSAASGTDIP